MEMDPRKVVAVDDEIRDRVIAAHREGVIEGLTWALRRPDEINRSIGMRTDAQFVLDETQRSIRAELERLRGGGE